MIESIAVSPGLRDAFSMTVMARMFAEGAGERRAWVRDSSEASVKACVKCIGLRSLIARLARIAGSFWKEVRIWVSGGNNRGIRGEMLLSERN